MPQSPKSPLNPVVRFIGSGRGKKRYGVLYSCFEFPVHHLGIYHVPQGSLIDFCFDRATADRAVDDDAVAINSTRAVYGRTQGLVSKELSATRSDNRSSMQGGFAPNAEACSIVIIKVKHIDCVASFITSCMHFHRLGDV